MALSRARPSEVPVDAVILSEEKALAYQWKIINNWEKPSEVWALRHTSTIGAALSAFTGIFINTHYRNKLRLGQYGKFSSYLPIVVIPSIFTILTHRFAVEQPVILNPMGYCPICLMMRSAALQVGFSTLYPTVLAPMAAFMFATRHFTYRLPSVIDNPKEVLKLWMKFTRPLVPALGTIAVGQAVIAMYLTYKELQQNYNLQIAMQRLEEEADQKAIESGAAKRLY